MPALNLSRNSVEWALNSLERHSDTDLFPQPAEFQAIFDDKPAAVAKIAALDLHTCQPSAPRRFIVPKDGLSYRAATQLDPLDSIIFTALMHQYGNLIESRRRRISESKVLSYRFNPSVDGDLYSTTNAWNSYWKRCYELSRSYPTVLMVDISDFYNQIYHHVVENQLIESGWPNAAKKWIIAMLEMVTATVSRGVPIGPHPAHLLAEASLIPVDNSLASRGVEHCRFVDDIAIFAQDEKSARIALYTIADIMDKQQRLILQRTKTRIMTASDFQDHCNGMIEDHPIAPTELAMFKIIRKYTGGNPYLTVFLSQISPDDMRAFSTRAVKDVLEEHLAATPIDYGRLRWFLRRIAQVGHPGAVDTCIERFENLIPAISDVCHYFIAVGRGGAQLDWGGMGTKLLRMFENPLVRSNEYFQMSVLSLFSREPKLNHIDQLLKRFSEVSPHIRREIILAASAAVATDWLRERKEEVTSMDVWTRRAFIYAAKGLPSDERRHFLSFLKSTQPQGVLEELLAAWAK